MRWSRWELGRADAPSYSRAAGVGDVTDERSSVTRRLPQLVLIASFVPLCWLGMMAVHELGHVVAAWGSGGTVTKVVLHPLAISRTDVRPNPHPLFVVGSGPLVGSLLPLAVGGVLATFTHPARPYARFFAGFCLIANGLYIGAGSLKGVGGRGGATPRRDVDVVAVAGWNCGTGGRARALELGRSRLRTWRSSRSRAATGTLDQSRRACACRCHNGFLERQDMKPRCHEKTNPAVASGVCEAIEVRTENSLSRRDAGRGRRRQPWARS